MLTLSELKSDIKNIEIICPYCFKYEFIHNCENVHLSKYIDLLKRIYNVNPKCSLNLNIYCLKKGTIWCTGCFNWICKNCSIGEHICNNLSYEIKSIYECDSPSKIYLTNINPISTCFLHNKPYLFYCNGHKFGCEECEDCDLPQMKKKREFNHGGLS